jgi:hypothetical protein
MSRTTKKSIECKCPLCNKSHYQYIFWTGETTPRKYCVECQKIIDIYDCQDTHHMEKTKPPEPVYVLDECR